MVPTVKCTGYCACKTGLFAVKNGIKTAKNVDRKML